MNSPRARQAASVAWQRSPSTRLPTPPKRGRAQRRSARHTTVGLSVRALRRALVVVPVLPLSLVPVIVVVVTLVDRSRGRRSR